MHMLQREEIMLNDDYGYGFDHPAEDDYASALTDFYLSDSNIIFGEEQPRILSCVPNSIVHHEVLDKNSADVVVYLSDPIQSLPPDDTVFIWYKMAVLIEVNDVSKSFLNLTDIHLVFLRQLGPDTCSFNLSTVNMQKGSSTFLLLVGVRQFAGASPICNGVLSFLKVFLTKSDHKDLIDLCDNEDIKILSKMSDEAFDL
mmetsp:Transcript_22773/g.33445  ORF Transcript_22773/g.33445 Transcript_22773/m.33445 type:complete len:200 (-) Transcript_22773:1013-1612(-)